MKFEANIVIQPFFGKPKTIAYAQLRKFYRHDLGENRMFVCILEYEHKNKHKKISFYDEDLNFEEFKEVLIALRKRDTRRETSLEINN